MRLNKATPVLIADDIEPCSQFWSEFGLECTLEVPGDNGLMFAIFSNGKSELMYQTRASAELDEYNAIEGVGKSIVYVEVSSIADIREAASRHPLVKAEHTTPYGAKEIYVRDPAGNVIGFAELPAAS
jgi:catechol 2,3-dioxygenase-like lactoylglutathione lyase family enzyme